MALLGKNQINESIDRKWEDVSVPEWGGEVRILELSSADRGYIEAGSVVANGSTPQFKVESIKNNREKVVAFALVDENFNRLYSNKEIAELGKKSGLVIDRLFQVAMRISGMNPGAVQDAEGNSEAVQSGSSDSD
jgi:hypothetical protein